MRLHIPVESKKLRASLALLVCCALLALPGSALGFADYPTSPQAPPSSGDIKGGGGPPVDLQPPVVTTSAPAADEGTDTVPIVLASVAFLVALGSVGFTLLSNTRMRRSLQPGA
jgi:hypothetical protein